VAPAPTATDAPNEPVPVSARPHRGEKREGGALGATYRARVREERLKVGEVPTRLYDPGGAPGLLLLGHGGGLSKDSDRFVQLARHHAEETGLAVVCIDAVDHGERRLAAATSGVPSGWHSRTTARMVADWQRVADELSPLGAPVAYVGFSMGALFGFSTVASMPSITAAVFVVGGIPAPGWTDDADLQQGLVEAAAGLDGAHVLMLNKADDELFDAEGVRHLFDSVTARSKGLRFFAGGHDEWGPDLIAASTSFVTAHTPPAR
jgi:pimeloyl-ACP methyl ester carboxylesterase